MRKKSELESLLLEYRKLKKVSSNIVNETLVHNTDFHCWLANLVIDTINYEKVLLDILNKEYKKTDINQIAEINSRPILSVSECLTENFAFTLNYSCYNNELGEINKFQSYSGALLKNIESVDLLITQSSQFENIKRQRDKLIILKDYIIEKDVPCIIGCYGDSNSLEFQERFNVIEEFNERLKLDAKVYNETSNGVDCKFLVKM